MKVHTGGARESERLTNGTDDRAEQRHLPLSLNTQPAAGPREIVQVGWRPHLGRTPPYFDAARTRRVPITLVDSAPSLAFRDAFRQPDYDRTVAADPTDVDAMVEGLVKAGIDPKDGARYAFLPEQDWYVDSAYALSARFPGSEPVASAGGFTVTDKLSLRQRIAADPDAADLQPAFTAVNVDDPESLDRAARHVGFPAVLKAVDGAGANGVFKVQDMAQLRSAAAKAGGLCGFNNVPFTGFMLEGFVEGTEHSVQGQIKNGEMRIASGCEKIVYLEPQADGTVLFRESGHIALPVDAEAPLHDATRRALRAAQYRNGPFQIDFIRDGKTGQLKLLEIGYRMSGLGVADLAHTVSGRDMGEVVVAHVLRQPTPPPGPTQPAAGLLKISSAEEAARMRRAASRKSLDGRVMHRPGMMDGVSAADVPEDYRPYHARMKTAFGSVMATGRPDWVRNTLLSVVNDADHYDMKPVQTRAAESPAKAESQA